ncbi:MAG TPA: ATP-binding cassette domain-containing protein, partial [Pseudonocardiaceae bacterium]|nr:ATP-binding cassette domain-containing protein [Pseudonocardiaceae bacterium]
MIALERVNKTYSKQPKPAVVELTLDVPKGLIVMLIGPSGCGKTTTLKMINRLIEPTSGRVLLDGEDVTQVNPDQLRRRIGY